MRALKERDKSLLEFIVSLVKHLIWNTFLFGVGCFIVKCLTLGRYPRTLDPRKPDSPDFQILAFVGLLGIVAAVIFFAWLSR